MDNLLENVFFLILYFYKVMNCQKSAISPLLPQQNLCERLNRSLSEFITSKTVSNFLQDCSIERCFFLWLYCHNFSVNSMDRLTPAEKFSIRRRNTSIHFDGLSNYDFFHQHLDKSSAELLKHQQAMLRYMFDLSKKKRKLGEQRFQESHLFH